MIQDLIKLSKQAGEAILSYYNEPVTVYQKENNSPLTQADLASHELIVHGLKQLENIPIISEEGKIPDYNERKSWERYWLIDPLDGTKEFLKHNGEFTVNIALMEHDEPVLGIVYLPDKNLTYIGEEDQGSFRINENGSKIKIHSVPPDISNRLTIVESRSHASNNLDEKLSEQGLQVGKKVIAGSSLKFCLVAEGAADIYPRFGRTMEWDTAAGDAVFRYSGRNGKRKSPLSYNKPSLRHEEFIIGI
ncbi:MAG: 3'(2'),5'-bisphosphate nucleotidase CysQ [Balneolales bacterium]